MVSSSPHGWSRTVDDTLTPSTRAAGATRAKTARAALIFTGLLEPTATSRTSARRSGVMVSPKVADRAPVVQRAAGPPALAPA